MSSCDLVTEFWQFSPVITKIKRPPKRGQAPNKCGPATNFKTAKALAQTSVTGQSLIGAQQKRFRNLDAGYVGGFEVDEQFELVGCSTGKSPGFVPFSILSTYPAARRYRSASLGP